MGSISPDGVAPSRMVGVSASVNLPLHHKVRMFSSGTGSPGWSQKKGPVKRLWWITGNDKITYEHQPELEYCKLAQPITAANPVQYVVSRHDPTDGSMPAF